MFPPFFCFSLVLSDEIVMVCWLRKVTYRKSSKKPPLSNKPPPFSEEESRQEPPPPHSIKPHLPLSTILILHKQLTWTDQWWFIQAGNSYWFWSSAAWPPTSCAELFQLSALVRFSLENCYHFLIVRKSSIASGNHKSVLEKPCSRWYISLNLISPFSLRPSPLYLAPLKSAWKKLVPRGA